MQSHASKKAIVIGGGIGGLTTGIALQRAGFEVEIYEKAPELREVGSGLPLWTNAIRALEKIGFGNELETLGIPVTAGSVTTWQGDILADLRTEKLLQRLGTISTVVHRAELHAALLKTFGAEKVHLGTTCLGFTQDDAMVCARFANGQEACGDVLIGADGLHSVIRAQLFGKSDPKYVGYTCWRGVAQTSRKGLETWAWGKGYQFGIVPMTHDRAYWFAQVYTPEGALDKPIGRKCEVLELFHDWHDPIPAVIEATPETAILRNDVYEHKHLGHWSRGRVALLGDAAHAMTPNLGQGACQAIEDAVVLAGCLKAESSVETALRTYEKRRVRRANTIGRLGNVIGQVVQLENLPIANIRDAMVKRVPVNILLRSLMWILDYQA